MTQQLQCSITLDEMLEQIKNAPPESLCLLECGEIILWDSVLLTAYSSENTHVNAIMNPMIDLRTHLGHALLWCRQIEISASSYEIMASLKTIYDLKLSYENKNYRIFSLKKRNNNTF